MTLYLVRHGIAAERGDDFPDDSKRPLTAKGIASMRKVARGLAALGADIDLIVSSPLVRAKQTADILAHVLPGHPAVTLSDALAPAGSYTAVVQELSAHARKERIALVGHEPHMGELAARLIGARTPLVFKKGGVCRIDFEVPPLKGSGMLQWLATPKMLRKLG